MSKVFNIEALCDAIGLDFQGYKRTCQFEASTPSKVIYDQLTLRMCRFSHFDRMKELVGEEEDQLSEALVSQLFKMQFPKKDGENDPKLRVGKGGAEVLIEGKEDVVLLSLYAVGHQRDSLESVNPAFSPLAGELQCPFKLKITRFSKAELKEVDDEFEFNEEQRLAVTANTKVVSFEEPAAAIRAFFKLASELSGEEIKAECHAVNPEGKTENRKLSMSESPELPVAERIKLLAEAYQLCEGGRPHLPPPRYPGQGRGYQLGVPSKTPELSIRQFLGRHTL